MNHDHTFVFVRVALCLSLPLLFGCLVSRSDSPSPLTTTNEPVPLPIPRCALVERGLALELSAPNGTVFPVETPIELRWTLRNTSPTKTFQVVQGGDGSEAGWREPILSLTAERLGTDGIWQPIDRMPYGRCGVHDSEWRDDIVSIEPGETLDVAWVPWVTSFFDLSQPQHVRFRAEYRYTAGEAGKGMQERGRDCEGVGIPAFTLISMPVELQITVAE